MRSPNKHIDDFTREARTARVATEGARVEWFADRTHTRGLY
jgi:hypothetical protein